MVAPAGYGKTTLLAKWAEADPHPFAWVALDARDDDAVVFLRYIAAAIHGVEPIPAEVFEALSGPGGSTWSSRVPRVGSALAALERPVVLVLDDLHAVANRSCLDDRMSGGLCDAVLETTRSADRLESLEYKNCFLVPLDRSGEWYRYHHLFSELLRKEIERSEPDLLPELNRRAMAWCVANDLTEAAVVYGHAAGETDAIAGLVDGLALRVHYDGRLETLEEWLGWFDDDDLRRYPALAVEGARVRALTGRPAGQGAGELVPGDLRSDRLRLSWVGRL